MSKHVKISGKNATQCQLQSRHGGQTCCREWHTYHAPSMIIPRDCLRDCGKRVLLDLLHFISMTFQLPAFAPSGKSQEGVASYGNGISLFGFFIQNGDPLYQRFHNTATICISQEKSASEILVLVGKVPLPTAALPPCHHFRSPTGRKEHLAVPILKDRESHRGTTQEAFCQRRLGTRPFIINHHNFRIISITIGYY